MKSSKYIGVSRKKCDKKWRAAVDFEGKKFHIGMFDDESAAGKAVDLFKIKKGVEPVNGFFKRK